MTTSDYAALSFSPLQDTAQFYLLEPGERLLTEDSPAIKVMTDFKYVVPVTIDPDASLEYALNKMKLAGVRMLLVTAEDEHILGIISAETILGERPVKLAQENKLSFSNLRVEMLMTKQSAIKAISMVSVRDACIGHILQTMQVIERKHLLVLDTDDRKRQVVRGLFSRAQIHRQLGKRPDAIVTHAHSLAEIQHKLHV